MTKDHSQDFFLQTAIKKFFYRKWLFFGERFVLLSFWILKVPLVSFGQSRKRSLAYDICSKMCPNCATFILIIFPLLLISWRYRYIWSLVLELRWRTKLERKLDVIQSWNAEVARVWHTQCIYLSFTAQ